MSGSASFPARAAYSARLPERTAYSTKLPEGTSAGLQSNAGFAQGQFGQSAPNYARQQQQYGPSQTLNYGPYPQQAATMRPPLTKEEHEAFEGLSVEQDEEINEAFSLFDLDKDGYLDYHEFRVGLTALGFKPDKPELKRLITAHGVSRARLLNPEPGKQNQPPPHPSQLFVPHAAFRRIAALLIFRRDPQEEIERAYKLFDVEETGYISIDDLRRVANELGEHSLDDQELRTMIDEFDYDGVGGITKEVFTSICLQ